MPFDALPGRRREPLLPLVLFLLSPLLLAAGLRWQGTPLGARAAVPVHTTTGPAVEMPRAR